MGMHDTAREILLRFVRVRKRKKKRKGGKLDDPLARREGDVRAKAGSEKFLYSRIIHRNLSHSRARCS